MWFCQVETIAATPPLGDRSALPASHDSDDGRLASGEMPPAWTTPLDSVRLAGPPVVSGG
jgi:hypothetical protein